MKSFSLNGTRFSDRPQEVIEWVMEHYPEAPDWERAHFDFLLAWFSPQSEFRFHTSGTTGTPREIVFQREEIEASARLTAHVFNITAGSKALLALPSSFVAGRMMLARAVVNGWNLDWVEPSSDPLSTWQGVADFAAFTPMQVARMLRDNREHLWEQSTIIIGGGSLDKSVSEALKEHPGQVWATYGMTETLTHVAIRRLSGKQASDWFQALPGIQLETDHRGCLVITAPHLKLTKLVTNDLVEWSDDSFFRITGRADDVINTGGVKVLPGVIEEQLRPWLREINFYISSVPDSQLGEAVALFIEGSRLSANDLSVLNQNISTLKTWERPRHIVFLPAFERTESGKYVRRKTL